MYFIRSLFFLGYLPKCLCKGQYQYHHPDLSVDACLDSLTDSFGDLNIKPSIKNNKNCQHDVSLLLTKKDIEKDLQIYYESIDDKNLLITLNENNLLRKKQTLTYNQVWIAFADIYQVSSILSSEKKIYDIYSNYTWESHIKTFRGECGSNGFKKEGDCYNREHIWPKSWYGGFKAGKGAQTDLYELYPSDGYVNTMRWNHPIGNVKKNQETYISTNGCKLGPCESIHDTCFEVVDEWKGDVARSYFYLSMAYMNAWSCCHNSAVSQHIIKPWLHKTLLEWHRLDPVDSRELKRNDKIQEYQGNRNPFIDHPEWINKIDFTGGDIDMDEF